MLYRNISVISSTLKHRRIPERRVLQASGGWRLFEQLCGLHYHSLSLSVAVPSCRERAIHTVDLQIWSACHSYASAYCSISYDSHGDPNLSRACDAPVFSICRECREISVHSSIILTELSDMLDIFVVGLLIRALAPASNFLNRSDDKTFDIDAQI